MVTHLPAIRLRLAEVLLACTGISDWAKQASSGAELCLCNSLPKPPQLLAKTVVVQTEYVEEWNLPNASAPYEYEVILTVLSLPLFLESIIFKTILFSWPPDGNTPFSTLMFQLCWLCLLALACSAIQSHEFNLQHHKTKTIQNQYYQQCSVNDNLSLL